MTKEERNAKAREWYKANKEQVKSKKKDYYQTHKQERKTYQKAYNKANKEQCKAYYEAHKEQHNAYTRAYSKTDLNSLGKTKKSIRDKSLIILKKSGIKIQGYEIHHCFGYEDPSKFIYCSKELHLKIHQFLRDNNIDAASDHWMAIRDLVNSTDEFVYIKC